jgi:uncharacterized repeat protein (TIGR01451 family)
MAKHREVVDMYRQYVICIVVVLSLALTSTLSLAAPSDAIVPSQIRANATFEHIGVVWWVDGDTDHDSSMTLEFRRAGESSWHPGAPAMRAYPSIIVDGEPLNLNYWAASALFLESGQTYELCLTLNDPDGGGATQVITATTRTELQTDPNGRQLHVIPGSSGGDGSQANPFRGLQTAASAAQPGDVFQVASGTYSPFQILTSGTVGHPIVFHGPGDGTAIVDGANTDRGVATIGEYDRTIGFIVVEGLTIQNGAWGVDAQNDHDVGIRRNVIQNVDDGIVNRRGNNQEYNQTISDNIIVGQMPWPQTEGQIPAEEGIDLRGTGNVVAYNTLRYFGDCISVMPSTGPSYANDVYGNDVSYCVDDGIEIDYNQSNVRVWRNRVMNSRMGVSIQPLRGGPAYIFRNEMFNLESDPIKMNNQPTGYFVVHNSAAKHDNGQSDGSVWRNAVFRNNLFLGTRYAFEFTTTPDTGFRDFDYDAWGTTRAIGNPTDPWFKWNDVRYSRLPDLQAIGVEVHGLEASFDQVANAALPASWDVAAVPGSRDLRLAPGVPEINAGTALSNLNDPFVVDGQPDMGAFEYGQPLPTYGPRALLPNLSSSTKQASRPAPAFGETITYTIVLRNTGAALTDTVRLTDSVPIGLAYVSGTFTATTGTIDTSAAPTLKWSGVMNTTSGVTLTYRVVVTETIARPIANVAHVDAGSAGQLNLNAGVLVNAQTVFLPLVYK